jgi:hypothetical protein
MGQWGKLFGPFWIVTALCLGVGFFVVWYSARQQKKAGRGRRGGSGQVVGIVGRMGSGKSYMAVRMAYRRLSNGANVCTNFTLKLTNHTEDGRCLDGVPYIRDELDEDGKVVARWKDTHWCPCKTVTGQWRQFSGWEDFATLENAVVIIDEAHLYAPSNKTMVFPTVARFKMSQARKFRLDVYWISQHENRVNSILRDLTNIVYVCRSWAGGQWFSAVGYEPENMRRKNQHLDRQGYKLDLRIANLYDTLQILDVDEHLAKDKGMNLARAVAENYNSRRGVGSSQGPRLVHRPADRKAAMERELAAAEGVEAGALATMPARLRCEHEKANHKALGWCRDCKEE